MSFGILLLILLALGALAFLVQRAPMIASDFKALIVFLLLVAAVVIVLQFFGAWHALMNWRA